MKVRDVMRAVDVVQADTPIQTARRVLAAGGVEVAPVVDGEHRVVGLVTCADLADPMLPNGWQIELDPEAVVAAVMAHHPTTAGPDDDLVGVVAAMRDRELAAVPVVDGDRVTGVVLLTDAAHLVGAV
ncbi:MAG: CBS domain-containing protein [Pseudonocardiaceae bacterium]|nr:MAG: CBS domain-containing protein [Pseudonocardiaceae bacterium]